MGFSGRLQWNTEIDKLESDVRQTGFGSKEELRNQVASLQAQRTELKEQIDGLIGAGEDSWGDRRTGVESAWRALDNAVQSAMANFRRTDSPEAQ